MKQLFEAPKKLRTLLISMVALLAGNALTSCSNDDELQVAPEGQKGYVEFSLSRGADTRTAYSFNEETSGLDATWSEGDKVVVFYGGSNGIAEVFDMVSGAGSATATFAKSDSQLIDKSGSVEIRYLPNFTGETDINNYTLDLSTQEGTLDNLGKYDTFAYDATLNNGKIESPSFQAMMSILHFPKDFVFDITATTADLVFSGGAGTIIPEVTKGYITVKDVGLTDGKLDNDIYVSVYSTDSGTVPTMLKVGNKVFMLPETAGAGKIYTFAESNLREVDTKTPLTLEAIEAGTITIYNTLGLEISYKKNNGDMVTSKKDDTSDIVINVDTGDKVQFFGDNATYAKEIAYSVSSTIIRCSNDCYIYGNIMSLIDSKDYDIKTVLTEDYTFYELFLGNESIMNRADKPLTLPATTLASFCYGAMFQGCTSLTIAPELPATTLAEYCYFCMFTTCTSLKIAPNKLPATNLTHGCYEGMFASCRKLTTAPELPATTLASRCYEGMFKGCSKLNTVTCLATDISAADCTKEWLSGVAAKGTFIKAASMTSWTSGVNGIPAGWDIDNY